MNSNDRNERRKTNRISLILASFAGLLLLSVAGTMIKAQQTPEGEAIDVSPPSQEITADPGSTIQIKAKVRNGNKDPMPLIVRIEDFTAEGSEGQVSLVEKGPWSITHWTTVTPKEFELKAGETKEVIATIAIPGDAAGGRYGSFVFSVKGKGGSNAAAVTREIASLFLVRISGPITEAITIDGFSAPAFLEFGPVPLTMTYNNTGNVHLKPRGVIAIYDMFGRKVEDVQVDGTNVFPQAKRDVTTKWNKTLLAGIYTASAIIYTGSSKNEIVNATTKFTVFPIRIAVVVIIVLVIIYLLRKRLGKALKALIK